MMHFPTTVWLAHVFCTFFLCGLIWTIQLVHYPGFSSIDPSKFAAFHALHSSKITLIVLPTMVIELTSAGWLYMTSRAEASAFHEYSTWLLVGLLLIIGIWLSTFLVQVPLHGTLSSAPSPEINAKLVTTNWWRTFGWTLRSVIVLVILARSIRF